MLFSLELGYIRVSRNCASTQASNAHYLSGLFPFHLLQFSGQDHCLDDRDMQFAHWHGTKVSGSDLTFPGERLKRRSLLRTLYYSVSSNCKQKPRLLPKSGINVLAL